MATFKWYLNRQGPQGQRGQDGAKGDPGNTPIFSDGQNTPTVYTMIIDLGDGNTFETKNLKYPMRDDGGDYLRYDISEDTVYLGEPNKADLAGKEGEVRLATTTSVAEETVLDTDAVSYELFEDNNEKVTTALGNLDDKIEDVDDKVDAEADTRARNDGILDNRISLAEGQITSLNNTKASKQELTDGLAGKANVIHTHTLSQITDAGSLAGKNTVNYQTEVTNKPTLGNLASKDTVNYETEVTNKPVIPIPGDGTITITQGGVTKGTFTTNQGSNTTIALDAGGGGGATYTEGPGITIDGNDTISVNYDSTKGLVADGTTGALGVRVDGTSIVMNNGVLTAPGPDLSAYATKSALSSTINFTNTYTRTYTAYGNEFNSIVCTYGEPMSSANYEDITVEDNYGTLIRLKPITGVPVRTLTMRNPYRLEFDTITIPRGVSFNLTVEQSANSSYGQNMLSSYDLDNAEWGSGTLLIKNFAVNRNSSFYTIAPNSGDFANSKYLWVLQIGDTNEDILVRSPKAYGQNFIFSYEDVATPTTTLKPATANRVGGVSVASGSNLTISGTGALAADNMRPTAGTAINVSNTEVSVKIDNNTIKTNDSGQLYADTLPSQTGNSGKFLTTDGSATSWAAVSQPDLTNYYTKTQTDSLLDGKISNNVVQSPLEYLSDTTGNLKYQNINTTTMSGSADNGYAYDYGSGNSGIASKLLYKRGSDDYVSFIIQGCTNLPSLVWFETALTNGINLSLKMGGSFGTYTYTYVLGHYSDTTFIEDAHVFALISGRAAAIYFPGGARYGLGDGIDNGTCLNITQSGTTLKWYKVDGNTNYNQTVTLSNDNANALSLATHIRVIKLNSQGSYQDARELSLSEIRVINPPIGSSEVATLPASDAVALFNSGTNIFDAHPESLSLKYDSNTLGVNANNELTVPTATTSNLGLVQPDGTTITIDGNGVISSAGGSNITIDEANLSTENFVEEGSPTITRSNGDVIVTSSSWNDYVSSANNIDINSNIFEVKTAIKPTVSVSSDNILAQREHTDIFGWSIYQTDTGLGFWMNKDNVNVFNQVFSYSFTTNVKYYIKLTGNGSEIGMYVKSENDSDYTKIGYISTNANLSFTNGPTPIRTCYLSGQQYINDTSVSKNGTMIYQGVIPFNDTLTKASTSQFGLVKVDGSTITMDGNGVISAAGSTPSNVVTTDTTQTITGQKTFQNTYTYIKTDSTLRIGNNTSGTIGRIDLRQSNYNGNPYLSIYQEANGSKYGLEASVQYVDAYYRTWLRNPNSSSSSYDPKIYKSNSSNNSMSSSDMNNFLLEKDMLDGTTIAYNSSTGKVSTVNPVQSTTVHNIVQLTQSEYDTLVNNNTVDSNTFYIITST